MKAMNIRRSILLLYAECEVLILIMKYMNTLWNSEVVYATIILFFSPREIGVYTNKLTELAMDSEKFDNRS